MLPFLKNRRVASVIVEQRSKNGNKRENPELSQDNEQLGSLEACAEYFLHCVEVKDAKGMASAFQSMFEICESYPEDQESQSSAPDNSYDAMNALSAQNK